MTEDRVWCAGTFRDRDEARPTLSDRSFRYGDAVFATLRVRRGRLLDAPDHLRRLADSAHALGIALPEAVSSVAGIVGILSGLGTGADADGVVRIHVSAGAGGRGFGRGPEDPVDGPWELVEWLPVPAERRLAVTVLGEGEVPLPALPAVKSASAVAHVLCLRRARAAGFQEGIRVRDGAVLEAGAANVFWVTGDTLFTPSPALPIYPGVTRSVVLEVARNHGWDVREGVFAPAALVGAGASFLTNATRGVEPVLAIGDREIEWPEPLRALREAVERIRDERSPSLGAPGLEGGARTGP